MVIFVKLCRSAVSQLFKAYRNMDTNLNIHEIEFYLATYAGWRKNIVVPNVSWGFFDTHEADLLIMTPSGYLTEIEIKRSYQDLLADFEKTTNHYENKVEYMYYAVPKSIAEKSWEAIVKSFHGNKPKCGMLTYTDGGFIQVHVQAPSISMLKKINKESNKLYIEEQLKIARLGNMRYWTLADKVLENYHNSKQ